MNDLIKQINIIMDTPIDELSSYYSSVGDLELLKQAHKNGYPWYEDTCLYAAENGHLECLKYAYENGCPWSINTYKNAEFNKHLECVKYARDNGNNGNGCDTGKKSSCVCTIC